MNPEYRLHEGRVEIRNQHHEWEVSAWNQAPPSEAGRLAIENPDHPVLPTLRLKFGVKP